MLPELTPEQRAAALEKAKASRKARATLLSEIGAGTKTVADVFAMADAGDKVASTTRIPTLLRAVPGIGKAKAAKIMAECNIADNRKVGGLGKNQRQALLDAVTQ